MKHPIHFLLLAATAMLMGCSDTTAPAVHAPETPKALREASSITGESSFKSYRNNDLVEELFKEVADKNPNYKTILRLKEDLAGMQEDSLDRFYEFNHKSESYYLSATGKTNLISDSVLKKNMELLLKNSQARYEAKIANALRLLGQVETNRASSTDLFIALQLTATLHLIEDYQKLLDERAIKSLLKKQEELIMELKAEIKKTGHPVN